MNPGTTVKVTGSVWRGRTGTITPSSASDVRKWPEYVRVKLHETFHDIDPQLIERDHLEEHTPAGQLGLFGGAP